MSIINYVFKKLKWENNIFPKTQKKDSHAGKTSSLKKQNKKQILTQIHTNNSYAAAAENCKRCFELQSFTMLGGDLGC